MKRPEDLAAGQLIEASHTHWVVLEVTDDKMVVTEPGQYGMYGNTGKRMDVPWADLTAVGWDERHTIKIVGKAKHLKVYPNPGVVIAGDQTGIVYKLSTTQQELVVKMHQSGEKLMRYPGGFWSLPSVTVNGNIPTYWVEIRTIRSLEKLGVLERINEFPEEWKDSRKLKTI
jgi:hypothetical protein